MNEIALAGVDIAAWIADGFFIEELDARCSMYNAELQRYSPEGVAFCAAHYPLLTSKPVTMLCRIPSMP